MLYYEEQKKEIATVKERNLTLSLSEADVKRLSILTGRNGLTISELLEGFIGDLVDGTYSHGSDERMYANEWFERCGFSYEAEKTFLSYLLDSNQDISNVEQILDDEKEISELKNELAQLEQEPRDSKIKEQIESVNDEIEFFQEDINDLFSDYTDECKNQPHGTLEEEMEKVHSWYNSYENSLKSPIKEKLREQLIKSNEKKPLSQLVKEAEKIQQALNQPKCKPNIEKNIDHER